MSKNEIILERRGDFNEYFTDLFWLFLVLLFAITLRFPLLLYFDVVPPDGVILLEMAETIKNGSFFTANIPEHHHHPLYPALISIFSRITHFSCLKSGQIVSLLASLVTIVFVYKLSTKVYNRRVGLYSAVILSLVPLHAFYSVLVLKEALYVLVVLLAIYYGILAVKLQGKKYFILAGILLGLAYLTRFDGILLLLFIPVFLIYQIRLRCLKRYVLLTIGFATIFYLIYMVILFNQTGTITISKKFNYYVNPVITTDAAKEKLIRDYGEGKAMNIIGVNTKYRGFIAKRIEGLYKNIHYVLPFVFPTLLMVCVGIGIAGLKYEKFEILLILVPFIYLFIFPFLKYPTAYHYILCITPFLSIIAGKGLLWVQEKIKSKHRFLHYIFLIVFFVIFVPWVFKPIIDNETYRQPKLDKEIGLYIRANKQQNAERTKIISPSKVISFYAKSDHTFLGAVKEGELVNYVKEHKIDYIILPDKGSAKLLLLKSQDPMSGFRIEDTKKFFGVHEEEINVLRVSTLPDW